MCIGNESGKVATCIASRQILLPSYSGKLEAFLESL